MKHVIQRLILSAALTSLVAGAPARTEDAVPGPVFSDSGPDAADYGAAAGYQPGTLTTAARPEHLVATYSRFETLVPARPVAGAATPWSFKRVADPSISYNFRGERRPIQAYLDRNPAT